MERTYARKRDSGHQGKPTWDIKHVWPDGRNELNGLRFENRVFVELVEPDDRPKDKDGNRQPVKVAVWVPGGEAGGEHKIDWGDGWWSPVTGWGTFSVVSLDGIRLDVYWEHSPYKAPGGETQ